MMVCRTFAGSSLVAAAASLCRHPTPTMGRVDGVVPMEAVGKLLDQLSSIHQSALPYADITAGADAAWEEIGQAERELFAEAKQQGL